MSGHNLEVQVVRDLLTDSFLRIAELADDFRDCPADVATHRITPKANTIAWLIWHLSRVQDDHIAGLAERDQVWVDGWYDGFALPFQVGDTGYGHSTTQVGQVATPVEDLVAYHDAVHAMTLEYVSAITADELQRVVDAAWEPPVTASVRLVSVIGDCSQHLGQAAYVRGIAQD